MPKAVREPGDAHGHRSGRRVRRRPRTRRVRRSRAASRRWPSLLSCSACFVQVVGYSLRLARRRGDRDRPLVRRLRRSSSCRSPRCCWSPAGPATSGSAPSLAFGLIMYASWFLTNPMMATRFDENLHVTTLVDMVEQRRVLPPQHHAAGLAALPGAGVRHRRGALADRPAADRLPGARGGGGPVTFILALFLLASRIGRSTQVGAATVLLYAGERAVLLLQLPVQLPDRRHRDADGRALPPGAGLRLRGGAALDGCWSPPRSASAALAITHHLTSWLMLLTALGAGALLLARRRAAPRSG